MIKPIAIPATCSLIGTPAFIIAKEPPQTDAIEEDPFDSVISDTTRIVYGNSSDEGSIGFSDLSAKCPCPISLLFVKPILPVSPTQ